jgi:hypothetical protein
MINKYWDLQNISLMEDSISDGDLIAYGTPKPKPGDPVLA